MKKIVNINLGGYPFTIDVDAYEKMEAYFSSLEKYFISYDNPHEIIFDIEIRMSELFIENIGEKAILACKDIDEAIKILGTPEDFVKEDSEIDVNENENINEDKKRGSKKKRQYGSGGEYRVGKKIFRDTDNKVVGGVCSGLSNYFGIADPIWIRLLFVVLIFPGISPVVYLALLILLPKARTETDKRAMRGEPIDIDTIANSIEEEIHNISDQFQDFTTKFKNRKKSKRNKRKY